MKKLQLKAGSFVTLYDKQNRVISCGTPERLKDDLQAGRFAQIHDGTNVYNIENITLVFEAPRREPMVEDVTDLTPENVPIINNMKVETDLEYPDRVTVCYNKNHIITALAVISIGLLVTLFMQ